MVTVNNTGLVTGNHVGKATITAKGSKDEAQCDVEVIAKYNTFTEPVFEFGASKATIKSKEKRTFNTEDATGLLFKPDKSTIQGVVYLFENGKMTSAGVFVNTSSSVEAVKFLIERYLVVSAGSGDIVGLMLNNQPDKATMSVGMSVKSDYVLVVYLPYAKNKTRSVANNDAIVNAMEELFQNAK